MHKRHDPCRLGAKCGQWLHGLCLLGDPQHSARGSKSEKAPSSLQSLGPEMGNGCITPAFLRIPNALRGDQNRKWLPHLYSLGGPNRGNGYITPAFLGLPNAQHGDHNQKWLPKCGMKIRSGYLTLTVSRPRNGQWLHDPCLLRDPLPLAQGSKPAVATSSLPSRGAQIWTMAA